MWVSNVKKTKKCFAFLVYILGEVNISYIFCFIFRDLLTFRTFFLTVGQKNFGNKIPFLEFIGLFFGTDTKYLNLLKRYKLFVVTDLGIYFRKAKIVYFINEKSYSIMDISCIGFWILTLEWFMGKERYRYLLWHFL